MILTIITDAIDNNSFELLSAGRQIADKIKDKVYTLIIGNNVSSNAHKTIKHGADKVFIAESEDFAEYNPDSYLSCLISFFKENNPDIILFSHTSTGMDLAPRVAFRLKGSLVTDCLKIDIDSDKKLLFTKSIFGGNAFISYSGIMPSIATLRSKSVSISFDEKREGEIVNYNFNVDKSIIRYQKDSVHKDDSSNIKLEDAKIIISGGRGVGGPEGFKIIEELATLLKGAVGASRPPCDLGWLPATRQIGLTGKIVSADIYFAIGISGASQHLAGMSGSKKIIAINNDSKANIFNVADYGVVGDYKKVLPALIEKLKASGVKG